MIHRLSHYVISSPAGKHYGVNIHSVSATNISEPRMKARLLAKDAAPLRVSINVLPATQLALYVRVADSTLV